MPPIPHFTYRSQLHAESVAVAVQGRFRGIVDASKDVGNYTSQTTDLHDGSFRIHQERRKFLAHPHDREKIRLVCLTDLFEQSVRTECGALM